MLLWRYWLRLVCSGGQAVQLRRFARLVWLAFAPMVQAFRLAALLLSSCGVLACSLSVAPCEASERLPVLLVVRFCLRFG